MPLPFFPQPKPSSRLQAKADAKKLVVVDEKAFKQAVWQRDKGHCRCCGRKVLKALARVPERGEVHHLHGRVGDLRFEAKCAICVCAVCHERLTGRVAEKWIAVGTKWLWLRGERLIDARAPVRFEKVI